MMPCPQRKTRAHFLYHGDLEGLVLTVSCLVWSSALPPAHPPDSVSLQWIQLSSSLTAQGMSGYFPIPIQAFSKGYYALLVKGHSVKECSTPSTSLEVS